jgi:hypothetical protein
LSHVFCPYCFFTVAQLDISANFFGIYKIEEAGQHTCISLSVNNGILQNQLVLVKNYTEGNLAVDATLPLTGSKGLTNSTGDLQQIFADFSFVSYFVFLYLLSLSSPLSLFFVYGTVLNSVVDPELFRQDPNPTFSVVPDATLGKLEVYLMGVLKDFKVF